MNKLEELIRHLGFIRKNGKTDVARFSKFIEKRYGTVDKYIKNERNIGGQFVLDLRAKIPNLNLSYFVGEKEPMFLAVSTLSNEQFKTQPTPVSARLMTVYGRVAAGTPIATWGEGEFSIPIGGHPKIDRIKDRIYGFIVKGDSFNEIYPDGSIVGATIIQKPKDGDFVITFFDTEPDTQKVSIKEFQWLDGKTFLLKPRTDDKRLQPEAHNMKHVRLILKVHFGLTFVN